MIARIDWEIEVGDALPYLRHRVEKGLPTPELEREPDMCPEAEWLYEAWAILSTDRPIGMATGPIPFSSVDRLARRYGLGFDEFEGLLMSVRRIDSHVRSKTPAPQTAPGEPPGRRTR